MTTDDKKPVAPEAPEAERVSRHDDEETNLGYAQGAPSPEREQDLDAKTETEAEHDDTV